MSNKNDEDEERLRNFLLFRFYLTDKELQEVSPVIIITTIVIIISIITIVGLSQ